MEHHRILRIEPLTADAFRVFGDVIERGAHARHVTINEGYAVRYDDLARIDVSADGGAPCLSIFNAKPRTLPFALTLLERHPLGTQAFMPLSGRVYLVVVSEGADEPDLDTLRCFLAGPGQGINYARGTWHHPLLALDTSSDFIVLDRRGPGDNCDERQLAVQSIWVDMVLV
jgi:ureidoglycolate lyase